MSYFLADSSGYVADFVNGAGLRAFSAWADDQGGAVRTFAKLGYTEEPERLAAMLESEVVDSPAMLVDVITVLAVAARDAKDILIISDGTEASDADEVKALGGPGSGNFGHSGRPGKVGGSGDGTGERDPEGFPADDDVRGSSSVDSAFERVVGAVEDSGSEYVHASEGDGMSYDARAALQRYQGGAWHELQNSARSEEPSDEVKALQSAILDDQHETYIGGRLAEPLVYRGLSLPDDAADKFMNDLEPGDVIKTRGFQSATTSVHDATLFLGSAGGVVGIPRPERGVLLEILANKGLYVGGGENEYLMPYGSNYRVIGVKKVKLRTDKGASITRRVVQVRQEFEGGDR